MLAGIDIFAHRSGADRRGQRRGDICGSENGIASRSRTMTSYTLLFPLALLILLPFSLLGARTRLLPSCLPTLMTAFFPLLTSPPVFLPFLPSGARDFFPCARVRLNRLHLRPLFVRHPRPLGRIPFPFLLHPSPVLASLPIPSPIVVLR